MTASVATSTENDSSAITAVETITPADNHAKVLNLGTIRKAIPEAAFRKSLVKSAFYFVADVSLWLASVVAMYAFVNSSIWAVLPFWQQSIVALTYWNVAGFFMWCLFVVGHDCGHTTFSSYESVNDIVGHVAHGLLLVPFYPWQVTSTVASSILSNATLLTRSITTICSFLIDAIICTTTMKPRTTPMLGKSA